MKSRSVVRIAGMLVSLLAIVTGALALAEEPAQATGVCCELGSDCNGSELCCPYQVLQANPCNPPPQPNQDYCIDDTSCDI